MKRYEVQLLGSMPTVLRLSWFPRRILIYTLVRVQHAYRPEVLEVLIRYGVCPTESTSPALVHEFVSDLYRFELRRLREKYVRGVVPKSSYSKHVVALRKKYLLISVPVRHWTIGADTEE